MAAWRRAYASNAERRGGSVKAEVSFDPVAGTIDLIPREWIDRPTEPKFGSKAITAIYDPTQGVIFGQEGATDPFRAFIVWTDAEEAEQKLERFHWEAHRGDVRNPPGKRSQKHDASVAEVEAWYETQAQPIREEIQAIDRQLQRDRDKHRAERAAIKEEIEANEDALEEAYKTNSRQLKDGAGEREDALEDAFDAKEDALEERFDAAEDELEEKYDDAEEAIETEYEARIDALEEAAEQKEDELKEQPRSEERDAALAAVRKEFKEARDRLVEESREKIGKEADAYRAALKASRAKARTEKEKLTQTYRSDLAKLAEESKATQVELDEEYKASLAELRDGKAGRSGAEKLLQQKSTLHERWEALAEQREQQLELIRSPASPKDADALAEGDARDDRRAARRDRQPGRHDVRYSVHTHGHDHETINIKLTPETIHHWLQPMAEAYPDLVQDGELVLEQWDNRAVGLLLDNVFVAALGVRFPKLSPEDCTLYESVFARPFTREVAEKHRQATGVRLREHKEELAEHTMNRVTAIRVRGQTDPRLYESNLARYHVLNATLAWHDQLVERLGSLDAQPGSFGVIGHFTSVGTSRMALLWPDRKGQLLEAAAAAKRRLADDVVVANARWHVERAAGREGMLTLANWRSKESEMLSLAKPEPREQALATVEQRLDELVEEVLQPYKDRAAKLVTGLAAVYNGGSLYYEIGRAVGPAISRPASRALLDSLTARREADLIAATDNIEAKLATSTSHREVDQLINGVLQLPGDRDLEVGRDLLAAAEQRKAAVDWETYLAQFSEGEQKLLGKDGKIQVPADYPAPTPDEMRRANYREFIATGGKRAESPDSVLYSMPGFNHLGFFYEVSYRDLVIHQSKRLPNGRYAVYYEFTVGVKATKEVEEFMQQDVLGSLALNIAELGLNGNRCQRVDEFALTPTGWRSPSVRRDAAKAIFDTYDNMLGAVRDALPRYEFIPVSIRRGR